MPQPPGVLGVYQHPASSLIFKLRCFFHRDYTQKIHLFISHALCMHFIDCSIHCVRPDHRWNKFGYLRKVLMGWGLKLTPLQRLTQKHQYVLQVGSYLLGQKPVILLSLNVFCFFHLFCRFSINSFIVTRRSCVSSVTPAWKAPVSGSAVKYFHKESLKDPLYLIPKQFFIISFDCFDRGSYYVVQVDLEL